ncbi:hypothetical protein TNCV_175741 [Trichonephila clavipes]|nr:hypothetical protein TNCV_175741 [Trichonephila clavipes]
MSTCVRAACKKSQNHSVEVFRTLFHHVLSKIVPKPNSFNKFLHTSLSIVGSSAPRERLFSIAGNIASD